MEPSGIRWEKLQRMRFIESQGLSFKGVNMTMLTKLQYCSNVTVLHLTKFMKHHRVKMLDLTPLKYLKSLVLEGCNWEIARHAKLLRDLWVVEVRGLGTLQSLGYLVWSDGYISSASMEDIACFTSLEFLGLSCKGCEKLPNLSNLKLFRVVQFDMEGETNELSGLSSKMTGLQQLTLNQDFISTSNCRRTTLEDPIMNPARETPVGSCGTARDEVVLEAKHKVFLSQSGAQKNFVEQVCIDLERCDRYPFFDKWRHSLGIGQHFPEAIFQAIRQCQVGVLILSEGFFTRTKWPMLELAAMVDCQKQNSKLVIMPVFLGISREQCRNVENHKRWESVWLTWKRTDPQIDVEKWKQALSIFGPTYGLTYNEVLGEVKFREEIVEAICKHVSPETRWDDSHVQGRSRLCQVIREKVNKTQVSKSFGVRVIGLYGVGGLGKTTICKTLCYDYTNDFQGKVAHVEFESDGEVELMRGVLRKLTDTRHEVLAGFNKDECTTHLKAKVHEHNVFLAIDNVWGNIEVMEQARVYLRVGFKKGSVVIITSRSVDVLNYVGVAEEDCMEMPKLDASEARSLFMHQMLGLSEEINAHDEASITRCVEFCRFPQIPGRRFEYHPLALKLLGIQSSRLGYDIEGWVERLTSNEGMDPIFVILRRSFDTLDDDYKLLFMDVVLYYPGYRMRFGIQISELVDIFEWLSMVHQESVESVKLRLQELKKKSVIEEVGDRVGVHDLWREFAFMETEAWQRKFCLWVDVMDDEKSAFDDVLPSALRQGALRRMYFFQSQDGYICSSSMEDIACLTSLQYLGLSCKVWEKLPDLSNLKLLRAVQLDMETDKRPASYLG